MGLSQKNYRSHLYENRMHPDTPLPVEKSSLSFSFWILSSIPFLLMEYFFEVEFKMLPAGLVFPTGFFLFWGFYQTLLFSKFDFKPKKIAKKITAQVHKAKVIPITPNLHMQRPKENYLPEKVLQNLSVLGLKPTKDWNTIQKRYRELAKQYHPDLNPDKTTSGTRFMIYDAAYRNLVKLKNEYFS